MSETYGFGELQRRVKIFRDLSGYYPNLVEIPMSWGKDTIDMAVGLLPQAEIVVHEGTTLELKHLYQPIPGLTPVRNTQPDPRKEPQSYVPLAP